LPIDADLYFQSLKQDRELKKNETSVLATDKGQCAPTSW